MHFHGRRVRASGTAVNGDGFRASQVSEAGPGARGTKLGVRGPELALSTSSKRAKIIASLLGRMTGNSPQQDSTVVNRIAVGVIGTVEEKVN